MRRLKSTDPKRQQRWRLGKRDFSIVDLTIAPLEINGLRATDVDPQSRFTELMVKHYGIYRYELAETTGDDIVILGRFTSFQDAKEHLESGEV